MKTREDAIALLQEWVKSESLRRHCFAVGYAMEAYAGKFGGNADDWFVSGLLHDFDYERYPTIEQHPFEGVKILKEQEYAEEIIEAIMGHGDHTGIPRVSVMAKCLFAVDELCGFLVALAKVRQDGFTSMAAESVEKALKKKGFAAAINRNDIDVGVADLGVDRKEHFEFVIAALRAKMKELGFS